LAHVAGRVDATVEEICSAIRQPSVSQTGEGIPEMADWVQAYLAASGVEARQVAGLRAPFVEGDLVGGGLKPTLLFYDLYDVQPAAGQAGWSVDPFAGALAVDAQGRKRIVGRGAFNSKGPLVGALAAVRAFRECGVELPVNIRFLIEGEEETGSPSLPGYIERNRDALAACDAAFIPYFGTDVRGTTVVRLGFKGLVLLEFRVVGGAWGGPSRGEIHALHGAVVASPSWELVRAMATLVDRDGRLTVDDLDALVPPPSAEDLALLESAAVKHDLAAFAAGLGVACLKGGMTPREALHATMFTCTLNIDALSAGVLEDGKAPATAIPRTARAFADLRILPGMESATVIALIRAHLDRRGFEHVEIVVRSAYPASRASLGEPVVKALIEATEAQTANLQVLPIHAGAAPMHVFSEILGIPYVFGGVGYGAGAHGPDEFIVANDVGPFMQTVVRFFYRYAEHWRAGRR
jgi:acetylornithine deacetylase/succinyl-diaminopimelate desuccinylase-like protein